MSIHDAIVNAAQTVLAEVLAPELADKLTADIVSRAQPEIEAALLEFVGFEIAKSASARGKGASRATPPVEKPKPGRQPKGGAASGGSGDMESAEETILMSGA